MNIFKKGCMMAALVGLLSPAFAAPKAQNITLTTQDGWNLSAVYQPADGKDITVVLLHDLGKRKEEFTSFEKALVKAGFGYLAVDLRGHGQSVGRGTYKTFAKEGAANPFNQMVQDGQTAVSFLRSKGIAPGNIILLGAGLGANVAAKTAQLMPDVAGIALISPNVNIRDVLVVPALRVYKGAVLIAASAGDRKGFLEASILRNVSFLTAGEGNVTFLTAYDFVGHELLDKYLTQSVIQWVTTPHKPESAPDVKSVALVPSILAD